MMQSEICRREESKSKCSFNGSCVNHRQPLSKFAISIYAATVPHYHRWDDLVLDASIDERFAFKETKSDLNHTILAATAIMCVGNLDRTPQNNGNNYLANAR